MSTFKDMSEELLQRVALNLVEVSYEPGETVIAQVCVCIRVHVYVIVCVCNIIIILPYLNTG